MSLKSNVFFFKKKLNICGYVSGYLHLWSFDLALLQMNWKSISEAYFVCVLLQPYKHMAKVQGTRQSSVQVWLKRGGVGFKSH